MIVLVIGFTAVLTPFLARPRMLPIPSPECRSRREHVPRRERSDTEQRMKTSFLLYRDTAGIDCHLSAVPFQDGNIKHFEVPPDRHLR